MSSQSSNELSPLDLPDRPEFTHRAHRFPGKFHPPLIGEVVNQNPDVEYIADPMCGSGTTGVESVVAGRDVLCVDIDPLCTLMTRAKTTPVPVGEFRALRDIIIDDAMEMPSEGDIIEENAKEIVNETLEGTPYCIPYNLNHWFEPYVSVGFADLLQTTHEHLKTESDEMADAVHTSLAAMVRQISRADPEPVSGLEVTKIREKELENGVDFDVVASFRNVSNRLAEGYSQMLNLDHSLGESTVVEADARDFAEVCEAEGYSPELIITSPPYCNAIEYSRRHRLEYEWLGLFNDDDVTDPRNERIERSREFIGSVTPRQEMLKELPPLEHDELSNVLNNVERDGNERKANLLRKYFLDAQEWLDEIGTVLDEVGVLYMIVGPSTSYGHSIDTPRYLAEIAAGQEIGLEFVDEQRYKLTNNKMQYPTDGETTDLEAMMKFTVKSPSNTTSVMSEETIERPRIEAATDLSAFQRNILTVLAEEARYGLAIKRELETYYDNEVNHGRLYPNLDKLIERGLVEKSELDKRTNEYAITDEGVETLRAQQEWVASKLGEK